VLLLIAMSEPAGTRQRRVVAIVFGAVNLVSAVLVYLGVFEGLPARYWPVDIVAAVVFLALVAGAVGLFGNARWGRWAARIAAVVALAAGLALVSMTAVTASYLSGIYGPVGRGGALILTLVTAMALPYLVVLPAAQLVWLGPWRRADSS
jgi:peptidoglycan/LPS O-acetylase OafA/YrhL